MDPITHTLSGIVIKQLGFKRKMALAVLIISAVAPDLDYVTRIWGTDVFLRYHRGITHGILALFIFPAIMGAIFKNKGGFFYYYALSFLAYGTHIFLDLTNQYGTRILSPLDWNQYSLDLTFIIDPYVTLGFLLCSIAGRLNRQKTVAIAVCTVLLFGGYIGGKYYLKNEARQFLKSKVDANIYNVYPLPNDFLRWSYITKSGNEFTTGILDLFTKRVCSFEKYSTNESDSLIAASKKNRAVQNFLYFAKYPHAEVRHEHGKTVVVWKELAYSFMSGDKFTLKAIMDNNGKVTEANFRF